MLYCSLREQFSPGPGIWGFILWLFLVVARRGCWDLLPQEAEEENFTLGRGIAVCNLALKSSLIEI